MSPFRVERLRSISEIEAGRSEWQALLRQDPTHSIYQSPAMYLTWLRLRRPNAVPAVLFVRQDGRLAGLAPMILRKIRVRGISIRSVEFCVPRGGIIAPQGRADILRQVLAYWRGHSKEWDLIGLHHLPTDSGVAEETMRVAAESPEFRVRDGGTGPPESVLAVERSWEDHFREESQKFRKTYFHNERTVQAMEGFGFDVIAEPEGVERSLEALASLESLSWKVERGTRLSDPDRELFRALMMDDSGELSYQTSILRAKGNPVAGLLCLRHDDRMYAFLTYYDHRYEKASFGSWLMLRLVKQCFEDPGLRELSFVGGFKAGKRWTDAERTYRHLRLYSNAPKSRLLHALEKFEFWRSEIERDA